MKKIAYLPGGLILSLLTLASPVLAENWVDIAKPGIDRTYFINSDNLKSSGQVKIFWGRAKNATGKTEWLAKFVVNCEAKKAAILEQIEYDNEGMVKSHYTSNSELGMSDKYDDLMPGTAPQAYYDFVCTQVANKPSSIAIATEKVPTEMVAQPAPPKQESTAIASNTTETAKVSNSPSETPKVTTSKPETAKTSQPTTAKTTTTKPETSKNSQSTTAKTTTTKPETSKNSQSTTAKTTTTKPTSPKTANTKPSNSSVTNTKPEIAKVTTTKPETFKVTRIKMGNEEYPQDACGDRKLSLEIYGVYSEYTSKRLDYIQKQLCRDAFVIQRKDGKTAIQVATFSSKSDALQFASFLLEKVGSAEVFVP